MSNKTIKITAIILAIAIAIPLLIYTAMVIDTNSVIHRAEGHFSGSIQPDTTDPLNIYSFNWDRATHYKNAKTVKYHLSRKFVWHNFKDGYIDVKYTCKYYDGNGKLCYGTANAPSKWIIHKENGQWKVVKIIEAP